jgi:hypothetical protein
MNQAKRSIKVNVAEIAEAIDNSSMEARHYLDLETGSILLITEDDRFLLNEVKQEYGDPLTGQVDWAGVLPKLDLDDEEKENLLIVNAIEVDESPRYLAIPGQSSREGHNDMAEFIATLSNARLQVRLENAIRGRGAFRAFKDALGAYPTERAAWFRFRDQRSRQRAQEWLEAEGIEPV